MNASKTDHKPILPECLAVLCTIFIAFGIRFWYVNTYLQAMPDALTPMNDAKMYWNMGIKIYKEGWLLRGEGPFYQAPLYSYFLAGLHHLGIHRVEPVLRLQALLGVLNTLLTFFIARFYLGRARSMLAALLFSLCHLPLFLESKLLATTLGLTLFLLFGLLFLAWLKQRNMVYLILSALGFSLTCLCRPNLLFTLPFLLLVLLIETKTLKPSLNKSNLLNGSIFLFVFILGVLPVPLRNGLVAGDWVPLSANSGVTLYMGTNEAAQGGLAPVAGLSNDIEKQKYQSLEIAMELSGEQLSYSQASQFWVKKTLSWVVSNPLDFIALEFQKFWWALYFNPPAVNNSTHFEGEWIPAIRWLGLFTWLSLFGGLALLPFLWRDHTRIFILSIWCGYLLLCLVYYASDRFLVTVLPFAAIGAASLRIDPRIIRLHGQNYKHFLMNYAAYLLVIAFLSTNPLLRWNRQIEIGHGYYNLGILHQAQNPRRAVSYYRRSLEYLPNKPSTWLNMGVTLAKLGNLEKSTSCFRHALELDPKNEKAQRNLRINLERME